MSSLIEVVIENSEYMEPRPATVEARLDPLSGIKAVLFDIYGTLFISGSGDVGTLEDAQSGGALLEALKACGLASVSNQAGSYGGDLLLEQIKAAHSRAHAAGVEYPEVNILKIWQSVLVQMRDEGLVSGDINDRLISLLAVSYECRANPCWPMPAVKETLGAIKDSGRVLGIVSNAQFYTPLLFEGLLGAGPADLGFAPKWCVYSYELLEAKPSTRLFSMMLNELHQAEGILPQEVVYVGNDMLNDMWTASLVGCRTVLFAGDRRSLRLREDDARCKELSPDAVITDLRQLVDVLHR